MLQNMEILILIGIFAFVVAILFRSNEALNRVGEVEKEVKTIEEEIQHAETPATEVLPHPETVPVSDPAKTEDTPFPKAGEVHTN